MEKSNTVPVHKRGDNLLLENYRPSQVNMGLEKISLWAYQWRMENVFRDNISKKLAGSGS